MLLTLTLTRTKRLTAGGETDLGEVSVLFETTLREDFNFTGRQARDVLLIEKHRHSEYCTTWATLHTVQQHKRQLILVLFPTGVTLTPVVQTRLGSFMFPVTTATLSARCHLLSGALGTARSPYIRVRLSAH